MTMQVTEPKPCSFPDDPCKPEWPSDRQCLNCREFYGDVAVHSAQAEVEPVQVAVASPSPLPQTPSYPSEEYSADPALDRLAAKRAEEQYTAERALQAFQAAYSPSLNDYALITNGSPDITPGFIRTCLLYTSPSPRDRQKSRMPSSA